MEISMLEYGAHVEVRHTCFARIKATAPLGIKEVAMVGNEFPAHMPGASFGNDVSEADVSVIFRLSSRALVFEKLLKGPPRNCRGGRRKQKVLKNRG